MFCTVSHWHLNSGKWVETRASLGLQEYEVVTHISLSPGRIIPPVLHNHFISLSLMLYNISNLMHIYNTLLPSENNFSMAELLSCVKDRPFRPKHEQSCQFNTETKVSVNEKHCHCAVFYTRNMFSLNLKHLCTRSLDMH